MGRRIVTGKHQRLLVDAINEYLSKGYVLRCLNQYITSSYRPDAIVENKDEVVIIESVITSDRAPKLETLQSLFKKPLRIDKRVSPSSTLYIRNIPRDLFLEIKKIQDALNSKTWVNFFHEVARRLRKQLKAEGSLLA